MDSKSDILQEQIAYYRARSAEYDEWFYRQGRYDQGEEANQRWFAETQQVRDMLHTIPRQDSILEIACGTGIWTQELVQISDQITALDAAPEMIAINKAKVQSDKVTYHQVDIFEWQPDCQYDMVFMGFWLSHVPSARMEAFLETVSQALKPDGILFIVDGRKVPSITATDQSNPETGEIMERILNDGRTFEIIKIFHEPQALNDALAKHQIDFDARWSDTYLLYGMGHKRNSQP